LLTSPLKIYFINIAVSFTSLSHKAMMPGISRISKEESEDNDDENDASSDS